MKVYLTDINHITKEDQENAARLFPKRMQQASGIRREKEFLRRAGACLLMWKAAGVAGESFLEYTAYGKPFARGCPEFNLSHSGNYIVLAAGKEPVGIDIEKMDPKRLKVAARVLTEEESDWVCHDPRRRFFTVWTFKESLLKTTGEGLRVNPATISVLPLIQNGKIRKDGLDYYGKSLFFCEQKSVHSHKDLCQYEGVRGGASLEPGAREGVHDGENLSPEKHESVPDGENLFRSEYALSVCSRERIDEITLIGIGGCPVPFTASLL